MYQIIQPFSILMQEGESMCRSLGTRRVKAAYSGRDEDPKVRERDCQAQAKPQNSQLCSEATLLENKKVH